MPLQPFIFPFPETRVLNVDGLIYKFKIRPGNTYRCVNLKREDGFQEELEEIVRTVLGNLNNLAPFISSHFTIYPYKKPWEDFNEPSLTRQRVYPYVLVLYLEKILEKGMQKEKKIKMHQHFSPVPKPKRRRSESPLEEAILKGLVEDMEDRSILSLTGKEGVRNKDAEEEVKESPAHLAKKTTEEVNETEDTGCMGDEEEDESEEEEEEEESPVTGGFLTRLASYIFPFSLFSRNHS